MIDPILKHLSHRHGGESVHFVGPGDVQPFRSRVHEIGRSPVVILHSAIRMHIMDRRDVQHKTVNVDLNIASSIDRRGGDDIHIPRINDHDISMPHVRHDLPDRHDI